MKTNLLAVLLAVTISVILLGSLVMPIIDSPGVTKEKVVGTNTNQLYLVDNDLSEDLELEFSNGLVLNDEQVTLNGNPFLTIFSDRFTITWWKANTSVNVSDIDLGIIQNVTAAKFNADGSYSFTKSDSSVVESENNLTWAFYPSNTGDFGSFNSANVDTKDYWYTTASYVGVAPWDYLVLNMKCGAESIEVTQSYLGKNNGNPLEEVDSEVAYTSVPTKSSDGLSYIVSNPQISRTITTEGTDYAVSSPIMVIAPVNYHYYADKELEAPLFGAIPVIMAAAILMFAVRACVLGRND